MKNEFELSEQIKIGSLWLVLKEFNCRQRLPEFPESEFDLENISNFKFEIQTITLSPGTAVLILQYMPKIYDHMLIILYGEKMYYTRIARGYLYKHLRLINKSKHQYYIDLD